MSEMGLSMSNPTVLEVTILEASQVDNGTEGIFGGGVAESQGCTIPFFCARYDFGFFKNVVRLRLQ